MTRFWTILRALFSVESEATWTLWIDTAEDGSATTFRAGAWTVVDVVPLHPGVSRVVVTRRLSWRERVRNALADLRRTHDEQADAPPTLDDDGYPPAGTVVSVRAPLPRRPESRPRL